MHGRYDTIAVLRDLASRSRTNRHSRKPPDFPTSALFRPASFENVAHSVTLSRALRTHNAHTDRGRSSVVDTN